jgi:hypothetical protein
MAERASKTSRPSHGRLKVSPWARVDRVQLIRREVREYLAPSALEVLIEHAEAQVEGGAEVGGRGADAGRVFATLMITIDLRRCARFFREPADTATAERVAELLEDSPGLDLKLTRMILDDLVRLAGRPADELEVTLERTIRAEGTTLLIDGDAMAVPRSKARGNRGARG